MSVVNSCFLGLSYTLTQKGLCTELGRVNCQLTAGSVGEGVLNYKRFVNGKYDVPNPKEDVVYCLLFHYKSIEFS